MASKEQPPAPQAVEHAITKDDLLPGDILVSTTDENLSKAIRAHDGSPYSHAALYLGGGDVVEAVGAGVRTVDLSTAMEDDTLVVVLRQNGITKPQLDQIRNFAKEKTGAKYDYVGVSAHAAATASKAAPALPVFGLLAAQVAVGASVAGRSNESFYCSELVFAAYQSAGWRIDGIRATSTPGDLDRARERGHLAYIGHLKRPPRKD